MAQPRRPSQLVSALRAPESFATGPEVLDELRRAIVSGEVPPGSPIPLDDVAALFGVSRIPVREALKSLLGEGLLEHQPRFGYTVTRLSGAEIAELYLVRGALESAAIETAARFASPADHARLAAVHHQGPDGATGPEENGYQRVSRSFHETMLAPCRMPRLLHILQIAWNLTEPVQAMTRLSGPQRQALAEDHEQMLAAYVAGEVDRLRELTGEHHRRLTECVVGVVG